MQDRVVVSESHVLRVDRPALALFGEQLSRAEDLGDEHGPLALGGRREKMKILPDGTANGARNPDVVLQPGPPASNSLRNELCHHGAALHPEEPIVAKAEVRRDI